MVVIHEARINRFVSDTFLVCMLYCEIVTVLEGHEMKRGRGGGREDMQTMAPVGIEPRPLQ